MKKLFLLSTIGLIIACNKTDDCPVVTQYEHRQDDQLWWDTEIDERFYINGIREHETCSNTFRRIQKKDPKPSDCYRNFTTC